MKKGNVKNYLEQIKTSGKHDSEYLDCLVKSLEQPTNKYDASQEIISIIEKRYDKNKKDNS